MAKRKSGARRDRGGPFRGGQGRGNNNDRGRGGAHLPSGPARGRGRGFGHHNGPLQSDLDGDFTLQAYADAPSPERPVEPFVRPRGIPPYRGRGRGRGGFFVPHRLGAEIPFPGRGRGFDFPRRHAQGIGMPKDARPVPMRVGGRQTLSSVLYQDRPLLQPIVFVPSTETRFLFQNEEELLQPVVEDVDESLKSPIPTADRVMRVFSGAKPPIPEGWNNDEDETGHEEEIEVVHFNEIGNLFNTEATTTKATTTRKRTKLVPAANTTPHEEVRNGKQRPTTEDLSETVDKSRSQPNGISVAANAVNGGHLFYVDTQPSKVSFKLENPIIQQPSAALPDDGDDVIVYVAPHPRNASRMACREEEKTDDVTPSHFSSYERPAALPTVASNEALKVSISRATDQTVSPTPPYTPDPPSIFTKTTTEVANNTSTTPRLCVPPITTPRQAKLWKNKLSRAEKKRDGSATPKSAGKPSFGALGAVREEDLLRRLDRERDDRFDERRRGDSDIEWGDSTDGDVAGVGEKDVGVQQEQKKALDADMERVLGMLEKGKGSEKEDVTRQQAGGETDGDDHGMVVDVDVDIATMQRFVRRLSGANAGEYVTMDDIECEKTLRMEDEDEDRRGSSGSDDEAEEAADEEEEALRIEETKFMQEGDVDNKESDDLAEAADNDDDEDEEEDGDLDDEDSDDEEYDDEDNSFQVRRDRLRALSMERHVGNADFDDDDEDDLLERNMTWADQDEALIQQLNDMLNEEADVLTAKDRKKRRQNTSLSDEYEYLDLSSPRRRRKDKYMNIPPQLQAQFEKDRLKKAERKKQRELERLARAADPLSKKKGKRKARRAMLAAAAADPTIIVLPNRVMDTPTLVQQIRWFVDDLGGPTSMSLPPADKETRKKIHEIARTFKLKSVSKGNGEARYTTLIKKSKTGVQVNEQKLSRILRNGGGERVLSKVPRHKEGDVVGKAAPKLDGSNVGFRLLAMMGWSEGDRIGASTNGLEAPLAAVIKTTKLGLGAKK